MIQPQSLMYFAEVARTGSLRQVSETFFVAPSAISKQIGNLEAELGATLFDRSPRGATLTEAGQLLLDYVHANSRDVEHLHAALDDLSSLRHGVVRVALVEAAAQSFMPDLMTEFSRDHPGIQSLSLRHIFAVDAAPTRVDTACAAKPSAVSSRATASADGPASSIGTARACGGTGAITAASA